MYLSEAPTRRTILGFAWRVEPQARLCNTNCEILRVHERACEHTLGTMGLSRWRAARITTIHQKADPPYERDGIPGESAGSTALFGGRRGGTSVMFEEHGLFADSNR
jgi:hypothetical protein